MEYLTRRSEKGIGFERAGPKSNNLIKDLQSLIPMLAMLMLACAHDAHHLTYRVEVCDEIQNREIQIQIQIQIQI